MHIEFKNWFCIELNKGFVLDKNLKVNEAKLKAHYTNPYEYDDLRIYREKYTNKDHGLPNLFVKK